MNTRYLIIILLLTSTPAWSLSKEACSSWGKHLKKNLTQQENGKKSEAYKLAEDYGYGLSLYLGADLARNKILKNRCSNLGDDLPMLHSGLVLMKVQHGLPFPKIFYKSRVRECMVSHLMFNDDMQNSNLKTLSDGFVRLETKILEKFDQVKAELVKEKADITDKQFCLWAVNGPFLKTLDELATKGEAIVERVSPKLDALCMTNDEELCN